MAVRILEPTKCPSCRTGDRVLGRLDLKGDRQGDWLLVRAAQSEPQAAIAKELAAMADWLDLPSEPAKSPTVSTSSGRYRPRRSTSQLAG
jgi:hypothetical protein